MSVDLELARKRKRAAGERCCEPVVDPDALTETEFQTALQSAGFQDIEIQATHRVHEHAASAIVRARKPVHA